MGLPNINIIFKTTAATAIGRSDKGVVAMILHDAAPGNYVIMDETDIPSGLSAENTMYIKRALVGGQRTPRKLIACVIGNDAENFDGAFDYLETQQFDYLVGPHDMDATEAESIASWVKTKRANDYTYKAVLPDVTADSEGIVNFAGSGIVVGDQIYNAAQYCGRIAGILAGTPMTISATYQTLPEVQDVTRMTKEEADEAIDDGKLVLVYDGKKVKIGRAVNSLTTTTADKGEAFKKIKIVETVDMIKNDIRGTVEDSYIGKFSNSYDNKCLLISAIRGYFEQLELEGILDPGRSNVGIDVSAQRNYLISTGVDISEMSEQQIKEANTGSTIFLAASIKILDAIEDINLTITI